MSPKSNDFIARPRFPNQNRLRVAAGGKPTAIRMKRQRKIILQHCASHFGDPLKRLCIPNYYLLMARRGKKTAVRTVDNIVDMVRVPLQRLYE
jgi:hypothetical protein